MIRRFNFMIIIAIITSIGCACIFVISCSQSEALATKTVTEQKLEKSASKPVSSNTFAPTYLSEKEDIFDDAMVIYDSSPSVPQGVYNYKGLVYVVVTIDTKKGGILSDTNKESAFKLKSTALLRFNSQLRNEYPSLPAKYTIHSRVVEQGLDDDTGIFRYAVVLRQNDIRKLIEHNNQKQ